MQNELVRTLSAAEAKIQYDAQVKKVLAQKEILAWILRRTVDGFAGMEISDIIPYIEGDPDISSVAVNPGESDTEQIRGMPNEDRIPGEGTIYYDIRFFAYRPDREEKVRILLNLEAQKNFWPGYRIETRGIFYAARMISAQLGTEFSIPDYNGIKKVVSIWLCMDAGIRAGNAISEYHLQKNDLVKGIPDRPEAYDKISVVLITLNEDKKTEDELLKLLNTLLSPRLKTAEKKRTLSEEFGIGMEGNAGKEVGLMCNLSGYVEEKGVEKGIEMGLLEAVARLMETLKCPAEHAMELLKIPEADRDRYRSRL